MVRSFRSWLLGRVQRKAKEHQSAHAIQSMLCRRLRSHASSHGLASRQQRQIRSRLRGGSHCSHNGCRQNCRRVSNPPPLLPVRKLGSKRPPTPPSPFPRQLFPKTVTQPPPTSRPPTKK